MIRPGNIFMNDDSQIFNILRLLDLMSLRSDKCDATARL